MLPDYHDAPIFDQPTALGLLEGDQELLDEVVALFRRTARRLLGEIRGCLESGDVEALVRTAHSVKGAAANVAAERLRLIAFDLEQAGSRLGEIGAEGFEEHLDALQTELDRFDSQFEPA